MPKGIPNEKEQPGTRNLLIRINEADFVKLEKLAADQYRTPALQAGFLLKQVLSQVSGIEATAEKILARAHSRGNGE